MMNGFFCVCFWGGAGLSCDRLFFCVSPVKRAFFSTIAIALVVLLHLLSRVFRVDLTDGFAF